MIFLPFALRPKKNVQCKNASFFVRFAIFLAFLCLFPCFPGIFRVRQKGKSLFFSGVPRCFSKKAGIGGSGLGSNVLSVKARLGDA